jgi:hypothetical protein
MDDSDIFADAVPPLKQGPAAFRGGKDRQFKTLQTQVGRASSSH